MCHKNMRDFRKLIPGKPVWLRFLTATLSIFVFALLSGGLIGCIVWAISVAIDALFYGVCELVMLIPCALIFSAIASALIIWFGGASKESKS